MQAAQASGATSDTDTSGRREEAMNEYLIASSDSFGVCDRCSEPAMMESRSGNTVERLCRAHDTEAVEAANSATRIRQKLQRDSLDLSHDAIGIILKVDSVTNQNGDYVASVVNPILGCPPGFGITPYRALSALGKHVMENADRILQKIVEDEMTIRAKDHQQ